MKSLRQHREDIKFFIWDYIDKVHDTFKIISIFVSFFTIGVIAYYFGYPQTESSTTICKALIHCSLLFYVVKYLSCAFFSVHTTHYLRKNKLEGIVVLCIIFWFIFRFLILSSLNSSEEISDLSDISMLLVQIYFFFMMIFELSNMGHVFNRFQFGPRGWMIGSFLLLISAGTILLMLPEMTTGGISFIDALFTATSASNITGLTVLDTSSAFTLKGQFVLLLLMQLGGINIICFATFLSTSYKESKIRTQSVLQGILSTSYSGSRTMLRTILGLTFCIELIGFLLLFFYWNHNHYYSDSLTHNLFLAAFHSVAAFNNSGISILEDGMMNPLFLHDYYIQWVTLIMFSLGSLGFVTLHDIFSNCLQHYKGKGFWKQLKITSRIIIIVSAGLVLVGTLCFFLFEYNNTCEGMSLGERSMHALFMASSARSSGFSTVDTSQLALPTIIIFLLLMFVGSSPTSTGGGIKVTTFYILIKSAIATIQNKKQVTIANRSIPGNLIDKSYTVIILALGLIVGSTLIISLSDPQFHLEQILFEVTSALGNVGLSVNICSSMSQLGKLVLTLLMFIGRITILTMAISVTRKASRNYTLVTTNNLSIS